MKFKKLFTVLLPLLAFMFIACGDSEDVSEEVSTKDYVNNEYGFSIVPPSGWVESSETYGSVVFFVNEQGDSFENSEPFYANLGIILENVQGLSFDEYIQISAENALSGIPELEFLSEEDAYVDGLPAQISISKFPNGESEIMTIQLTTLKDGEAYVVTGASLASAWSKNEEVFRNAISTFTFEK